MMCLYISDFKISGGWVGDATLAGFITIVAIGNVVALATVILILLLSTKVNIAFDNNFLNCKISMSTLTSFCIFVDSSFNRFTMNEFVASSILGTRISYGILPITRT